jgi:hypothetical protein
MSEIVKMRDVRFEPVLFVNYRSGTVLDNLLCSYKGLPKGVNYITCKRKDFCPDPIA